MGKLARSSRRRTTEGRRRVTRSEHEPPRTPELHASTLKAPRLLRWLVGENNWHRLARCERCRMEVIDFGNGSCPCPQCQEGTCKILGLAWWERASARIRQACQRRPELLSSARTDWEANHEARTQPVFRAPFDWLNRAWARAGKRPGRRFSPQSHYNLAHIADQLKAAGARRGEITAILTEADPSKRQALYDGLKPETLRFLAGFGKSTRSWPRASDAVELWRSIRWAHRQWMSPGFRVSGEKPRRRPSRSGP